MESSTPIHLALDSLEAVNLSFSLAVAPGSFHRCNDRVEVLLQAVCESNHRPDTGLGRSSNPMKHAIPVFFDKGLAKIQGQEPHRSNDWTVYGDLLEQNPLLFGQTLCWSARQDGRMLRCDAVEPSLLRRGT